MCFQQINKTAQAREILDIIQIWERTISDILQFEISHLSLK